MVDGFGAGVPQGRGRVSRPPPPAAVRIRITARTPGTRGREGPMRPSLSASDEIRSAALLRHIRLWLTRPR